MRKLVPAKFRTGGQSFALIRRKEHENPNEWICRQLLNREGKKRRKDRALLRNLEDALLDRLYIFYLLEMQAVRKTGNRCVATRYIDYSAEHAGIASTKPQQKIIPAHQNLFR